MATIVSTRILRLQAITPRTQDAPLPEDVTIPGTTLIDGVLASDIVDQAAQVIGFGQTWQDMTASRVMGTPYTNSTGKPIMVNITMANTSGVTAEIVLTIDGLDVAFDGADASVLDFAHVTAIVPNGSTYEITFAVVTGISLYKWIELR